MYYMLVRNFSKYTAISLLYCSVFVRTFEFLIHIFLTFASIVMLNFLEVNLTILFLYFGFDSVFSGLHINKSMDQFVKLAHINLV